MPRIVEPLRSGRVPSGTAFYRPAEVDLLLGDATKARRVLNWKPAVTFRGLAKMMTESDWELARRERYVKERGEAAKN